MNKIESLHQQFETLQRLMARANDAALSGNGSQRKAALAWKKEIQKRINAVERAAGMNA